MFQDKDISVFFDSLKILDSKDVVYSLTKKLEIEKISQRKMGSSLRLTLAQENGVTGKWGQGKWGQVYG